MLLLSLSVQYYSTCISLFSHSFSMHHTILVLLHCFTQAVFKLTHPVSILATTYILILEETNTQDYLSV